MMWLNATLKTIMLTSAVGLVGLVVLRTYLFPSAHHNRGQMIFTWLFAILLLAASALDVVVTIRSILGYANAELVWNYLQNTRHGLALWWRLGATLGLAIFLSITRLPRAVSAFVMGISASLVLLTFSAISHAAAMGGRPEIALDWLHFMAAASWAGGLVMFVIMPTTLIPSTTKTSTTTKTSASKTSAPHNLVLTGMNRLSQLGLGAVTVLMLTGILSARLHVSRVNTLVTTSYGWALLVKVGLVLITLMIAAANRWIFLPAFQRQQSLSFDAPETSSTHHPLIRALRYEAVLLVTVLAATGVLSTQPMPHE
ncbi:MAG: CopD family protein [Deinococcota bacterium]